MEEVITTVTVKNYRSIREFLKELWHYRGFAMAICKKDCKTRYSQTIFGPLWYILYPLTTAGIFSIIFGMIVKIPSDGLPYVLFYLSAIVIWYAFSNLINLTINMLPGNISLINKVYVPKILLAAPFVAIVTIDFCVGILMMSTFGYFYNCLHIQMFLIAPIIYLIFVFCALGVALLAAPINNKFRDINHITPFLLQTLYYASPIIYPVSHVPHWIQWWFRINPIGIVVNSFRAALAGRWPDMHVLIYALLASFLLLLLGAYAFVKQEAGLVDRL